MLLPEPTYKGPESIVYFRAAGLDEELERDQRVTWLVTFYAAWSPSCVNFSPIYSQLSARYSLPNLKFGKNNLLALSCKIVKFAPEYKPGIMTNMFS